jgi:hypothetical protein
LSLLIFQHYKTHVAVFTDTLATTPEGEPLAFFNKTFLHPQFHMLMVVTGIFQLADKWNSVLNGGMVAKDIDMVDLHTPEKLRSLWKELQQSYTGSLPSTSTVYHFGFSKQDQQYVRYAYRSTNNFNSERSAEEGIGIKPQPESKTETPETIDAVVDLASKLIQEQSKKPKPDRIYIGGEIFMTLLSDEGIVTKKVHIFDSYNAHWDAVNETIRKQAVM